MRTTTLASALLALTMMATAPSSAAEHGGRRYLAAQPNASAAAPLRARVPFAKLSRAQMSELQQDDRAVVKFAEGTAMRLRKAVFDLDEAAANLERAVRNGVDVAKLKLNVTALNDVLSKAGVQIRSVFAADEEQLKAEQEAGERRSGTELADLNLFFELQFAGKRKTDIIDLLLRLNELDVVESVWPKLAVANPRPFDIPPTTAPLTANQTYFAPASSGGIDVGYARQFPGGRGEGVRVVDVEAGWDVEHEDFPDIVDILGYNYFDPVRGYDHGTAAMGVLGAYENAYGMTGISPAASFYLSSNIFDAQATSNLALAMNVASNQAQSGGIILIEQSVFCGTGASGISLFCPAEYDNAVLEAIKSAIALGRIVIVTAGNSAQNLDDPKFNGQFTRNGASFSGAIYVGAGHPTTRQPLSFSNYGSRLDLQGWGQSVATLGYGDLQMFGNDVHQSYTATFNGTSSAGAIVAGAATILQGVRKARGL
ncbi:MAG TPA: S8 family serine peptidase, partial [Thermoanaerobaculia bacterium]